MEGWYFEWQLEIVSRPTSEAVMIVTNNKLTNTIVDKYAVLTATLPK